LLTEIEKNNPKIHMETQNTLNSQTYPEQNKQKIKTEKQSQT
jgi:hypothetical protein